jgi:hypothetical protein
LTKSAGTVLSLIVLAAGAVAASCGGSESGLKCKGGDFYLDGREFSSCDQCPSENCGFQSSYSQVCTYPNGVQRCTVTSGTVVARCGDQTATVVIRDGQYSCGSGSGTGAGSGSSDGSGGMAPPSGAGGGRPFGTGGASGLGTGGAGPDGGIIIGPRPGTGGTAAGAGTGGRSVVGPGTGGATGGATVLADGGPPVDGGAPATDGGAGAPCRVAPRAEITDFSDWDETARLWGTAPGLRGTAAAFGALGGSLTMTVDGTAQNLHAVGSFVPDPALSFSIVGVVFPFEACVDASAYDGVQLDVAGTLGGATVQIGVSTRSNACPTCMAGAAMTLGEGLNTVRWSDLVGASPNPFDPREVSGIQVVLTGRTSTPVDFRIDDLSFVPK